MKDGRIVIAGGSGTLGTALAERLQACGRSVLILSRKPGPGQIVWDGKTVGDWKQSLEGAEAVFNLAGRSIDCRFTPENRRQILASRVDSTRAIAQAIAQCSAPPKVWLQASATGIYGDTGEALLDESAMPFPPDSTDRSESMGERMADRPIAFMQGVCLAWERVFAEADAPATRKLALRSAPVLDSHEGAFAKLLKLTKWGLGGAAADGRQWFSWIHVDDWASAAAFLLENSACEGAYNLAAPSPVRNGDLMAGLRRAAHRPWSPPAPAPAVRLGAWLMGTEGDLALQSAHVSPSRLSEAGFQWRYPDIESAIPDLIRRAAAKSGPSPAAESGSPDNREARS